MNLIVMKPVINPELEGKIVRVHGRVGHTDISIKGHVIEVDIDRFTIAHLHHSKSSTYNVSQFGEGKLQISIYDEVETVTVNTFDDTVQGDA